MFKTFYDSVKEIQEYLPEWPVVVSLSVPGTGQRPGVFAECDPRGAATLIVEKTHRLASDEEAANWRKEQATKRDAANAVRAVDQAKRQMLNQVINAIAAPVASAISESTAVVEPNSLTPATEPQPATKRGEK